MVLKLFAFFTHVVPPFENDVEMYGAQTQTPEQVQQMLFENDVEMYGAQTDIQMNDGFTRFENDVEMYGAQTVSADR